MAAGAASSDSVVTEECLVELLDFFIKSAYKARNADRRYEIIHKRCIHMVGRDYKIDIIDNKLGQLCPHYPSELIMIERELEEGEVDVSCASECVNDVPKLRELILSAKFARCRSRFVVPVILYENKNVCRSSTLSSMAELYGRSGFDWILALPTVGADTEDKERTDATPTNGTAPTNGIAPTDTQTATESDWILLNKVRGQDVQLLKALGVKLICDLMVEKKKLKYGLYVCSSEKVDKWARYADFHIASMPYPGMYGFVDAELNVPNDLEGAVEMPYKDYQEWDLVEMTQNYLKMLLQFLVECDGGVLVHCISGWDRTPLYISLLRLSLWADGKVHRSLHPAEMLYFTLAYDWLIYGHQFKERHDKGEEVMYFCFDFLKYIVTEDFSVLNRPSKSSRLTTQTTSTATIATPTSEMTTPTATMTATASMAIPTNAASTRSEERHGTRPHKGRGGEGGGKMKGFDINPPLLGSSYELGESWVGVDSGHTSSASASVTPNHRPVTGSPGGHSVRGKRLNQVRELFLKVFRDSVPETPDGSASGGTLAGLTGFLSKLASSVVKTGTSV